MAHFDCYTQTAIVAWFPSDGAISYQVTATPTSGDDVTVDTASTDCELEGLQCGESYTVTVTALGEDCRRSATMIGKLKTGEWNKKHFKTINQSTVGKRNLPLPHTDPVLFSRAMCSSKHKRRIQLGCRSGDVGPCSRCRVLHSERGHSGGS